MKKVVAACIDRILEFDTQDEAVSYIEAVFKKNSVFRILYHEKIEGKYQVRIREQYNKSPMIED
jgi:hypothetical protein